MSDPVNVLDSFDARDWAKSFVLHCAADPSIATDEDTMLSWFSSALMRGFDESQRTHQNPPRRRHHRRIPYNERKFWEFVVIATIQRPVNIAYAIQEADAALVAWRERWGEADRAEEDDE